ncbi:hypothetical protein GQ457_01G018440 [Hibiscus cannabinus]
MFDLAIKTTLEKTLAAYSPWFLRQLPCLRDLSNLDVSRRNQVVIFLRELCVLRYLRDPGNEEVRFLRLTIQSRRLGDQLVREFNRRTKNARRRPLRKERDGYTRLGGYMLPCRASFLHVEPSRLKLGFLAILLAWDGPP